jgi:hypothetical protein
MHAKRWAWIVAIAVTTSVLAPPSGVRADVGDEAPEPVLSPELFEQLQNAYVGGKRVCGASLRDDGRTALYAVRLWASWNTPDRRGLYRRDLVTGAEELVTTPLATPRLDCGVASGDGQLYAFVGGTEGFSGEHVTSLGALTVLDLASGTTTVATRGADGSPLEEVEREPLRVTADHRYVFFMSDTAEVIGGTGYHPQAVFRYDTASDTVELATPASDGGFPDGAIDPRFTVSANGERIAFETWATNLLPGASGHHVYVRDLSRDQTIVVSNAERRPVEGTPYLTEDGARVIYDEDGYPPPPGKYYSTSQVVSVEVDTGRHELLARTPTGGVPAEPTYVQAISGDGRLVVFASNSRDLVDDVTYPPPPEAVPPSSSFNLHLYAVDASTGVTRLITRSVDGDIPADHGGAAVSMDRTGAVVMFESDATDLVPGYSGSEPQVYAYRRATQSVTLVSHAAGDNARGTSGFVPEASRSGDRALYSVIDSWLGVPIPHVATLNRPGVSVIPPSPGFPYGAAIPLTFEPTYSPRIDPTYALATSPACTSPARTGSAVGVYPIRCLGGTSDEVDLSVVEGSLTITPAPTTLDVARPWLEEWGTSSRRSVSAVLTSTVTGQALPGQVVDLAISDRTCTATTDSDGRAMCTLPLASVAAYVLGKPLTARFAGAASYLPSNGHASVTSI